MDDTIYRQAALVALLDKGQRSRRYKLGDVWELNFDEIKEVINALPPEPRWIPCSEKLPESDDDVLVTVYFAGISQKHGWNAHLGPKYYVEVARYSEDDEEWYSDSDEYKVAKSRHKVIAWSPLPEPYKEEP